MRFFTDNSGNFNWSAIGALCAVVGTLLGVVTFFLSQSGGDATAENVQTVLGDYVAGDKIEGITLEQYEAGLARREKEISSMLKDQGLSDDDAKEMRAVLRRIDTRQANLEASYRDVEKLTAEIRAYHQSAEDQDLIAAAVKDIFDGNSSGAVEKILEAGIPIETVGAIENTSTVFQEVRTEADMKRFVVGRELVFSNGSAQTREYGADGSIIGRWYGNQNGVGSWGFVNGKYCEEFKHEQTHYPQYCPIISVTRSAVKFEYADGTVHVYAIKR